MIKKLTNLPIRQKFAVVIIPLIVIILAFDYLQVRYHFLDYSDSIRLDQAITVGIEINHVVHEIQKERSISTGFLSNEGASFTDELQKQRKKTDSTLNKYFSEIKGDYLDELLSIHQMDLDRLSTFFQRLQPLRSGIDQHKITSEESIEQFSKINNAALNTVIKLIDETRDKEVAQQVHALIYFLKSKEFASIERAIGTQAFSLNHLDFDLYNRFTTLVAKQDSYNDAFRIIADREFVTYYSSLAMGDAFDEVVRMREVLFQNDELTEDANHWYDVSTDKINQLKKVEDYMSDNIQSSVRRIKKSSVTSFWTFLILDITIGVAAFWLMSTIVTNLLKNVRRLEGFTKKISSGDLSKKVTIDAKDELGQYADTFNKMVFEIRKSHFQLRKQRDKANFMYKNIYGVSLVVFENIQQGIFLLDKELKISRFHSKAMKDIFSNDQIAGENFINFMRPLVLPRELEALEMFMRHLFKSEIDEEVINQLNPVDQVKIHTEKDGIISSKYVRVAFTRIFRKDKIVNIMVTVSDETESILLRQHLEETEKKKQLETERVLSILKIDPSVLRGFLYNSQKTLKSISKRYEENDSDKYADLLSFTFDIVHNLKGNAQVIGMDIMADKFHEIEEAIIRLQSKEVMGKDFLAVLYEVDEADRMMTEISEMLNKIVNIHKSLPAESDEASKVMIVNMLEHGAETLSKELGKNVELVFQNEDNVVIAKQYLEPFKDIMIQLIRNSIVHGIESPDVRTKKGKETMGMLRIELYRDEHNLLIKYSDDGKGLDMDRIKMRALENGLVTETGLKDMSEEDLKKLIFQEGFSTIDESDKHAGRGQGMQLINNLISENSGSFDVHYVTDELFEMTIRFPYVEAELTETIEE